MKREEKIEALKKILDGVPIKEVFPSIQITIIEMGELEGTYIKIEPSNCFKFGSIPRTNVEAIIAGVKEQNPLKLVEVNFISKETYGRISEAFEREF